MHFNLTVLFGAVNVTLCCFFAQDLKSEQALQGLSSSSAECEGIFVSKYYFWVHVTSLYIVQ